MIITVLICFVIYSTFSFAVTGIGIADIAQNIDSDTALALVFKKKGVHLMTQLIYIAAMFGATASSLVN